MKVRVAGGPKPGLVKLRAVEPAQKSKDQKIKLRIIEPGKKDDERRIKLRVAELSPDEKERRIKEIVRVLWAKKGEASMDEVADEAAKQGIGKRDIEKFIENEKKRGSLDTVES